MANLTDLGIAEIRDGFRAGDFSAREVADAFNVAVAGAKALNAFIVETPDHAIAAAEQADRDRSDGNLRALSGVPIGMKDLSARLWCRTGPSCQWARLKAHGDCRRCDRGRPVRRQQSHDRAFQR